MRHVSLHDTIDTPLHTPAHTRLLERTPPYNRLWALAFKQRTDDQHFHFRLSSGGHRYGEASPQAKQLPRTPPYFWLWLLDVTRTVWETTIPDDCDTRLGSYEMSSTTITITKFNGTNYAQWATEMGLLLEQKQVYGIIKGYNDKPEEQAANATATEKAAFKDWMNRHGVAWSTILLGMEPRIQAEYTVVDDAKTLWEKLASAYKSKLKLNIFEIREDLWSIKLQDCGDVDNYASRIDRKVKDYNLCAGPTTTDTDADANAKTIAKMSEQEHIFYLLRGIPRNDEWKVFLELMMDKNATMTATPDEIVTKLVEKEAAIKREKGLAPEALLFAKKGGGNGGKAGKGGKSPRKDKRDSKDERKEKDFRKCFHCQRRGHTTENCLSKQRGDPPKSADTAAKASTEASATSTLTTSIKNYWMVASSNASSSDWFIDCGCTTHISGRRSMFITYTEYSPNTKKVKG